MKSSKMLLGLSAFVIVSSSVIAMQEAVYKPKVWVQNNNTKSLVGASIGIKCIINGVSPDFSKSGADAFFIAPGEEKLIGQLGLNKENDIITLDLQPSSKGTGTLSGYGKESVYPVTDTLNQMLAVVKSNPNKDILVVVDNNTYSGYWNIACQWKNSEFKESTPLGKVAQPDMQKKSTKKAPTGGPKAIGGKTYSVNTSQVSKPVVLGQVGRTQPSTKGSEDLMKELQAQLDKRRQALTKEPTDEGEEWK